MIKDIFELYIKRHDFFLELTLQHIIISAIAIAIAIVVGLVLGVFISQYRRASSWVLGLTNFIYTIPSIALFGFLIPVSGIGNTTAVVALSVYALLPMVRNTYTGITGIDNEIIEAARGMGSTPFQILNKIKLPLAFPVILSGIRTMMVMTIALAGIAAFIGAGGLGVAIYRGITTNNGSMTVAGSLLIALLALLADYGVGCYERHILKKRKLK
ncbi:ABC transporter permease [Coprobacter tertius]|uniref:ABC transporter permease n=1 Tax=Coprobacter tertius TaxID=2944915 RepID=A0ABT1MI19_9BACT|nr:ABC transporter permease [Coprobacter tertius]MCP9612283.1 ABC transporter permease [Coprobacter tertius]